MNVLKSSLDLATNANLGQRAAVLPLSGGGLLVDASGGYARVRLSQRFENPHDEPLSVTYKLPLPADAAVSDFAFVVGEKIMRGKVKPRSEARQDYERALVEGRSAALLEQDRPNLFTQEIANIPPKTTVVVEIDIDQPLAWLNEGAWEWRFPLTTAPRYLGAHVSAADEHRLALEIAKGDTGVRTSLDMTVRDGVAGGRSPESPSHPLSCLQGADGFTVQLGSGNRAELDRDLVVRWNAALPEPGLALNVARVPGPMGENMFGLLTIVPPSPEARAASIARDLTLLLDTSGSMSGEPLAQAKRMACALVDSLAETDLLELIEFSNQARAFRPSAQPATARMKQEATAWIQSLNAQGGTEMVSGVERAMRELRAGSQRQIILITDGLVGFEEEIVTTVLARLPLTARLHCVGVGSAVNRSLVAPIARAGRGVEAIVGLGEDAERAAKRVLAGTVRPLLVDVVLEGSALRGVMPSRLPDVFEGSPLRAAVEIAPTGGRLRLRARMNGTAFVREIQVDPVDAGTGNPAIVKLFGRELVEDLEMRLSSGENKRTIEAEIERVGVAFQISTRLTSWIAETEQRMVDPRDPSRHLTQPNALAYGLSAEGLGLREANLTTGTYAAADSADTDAGGGYANLQQMYAKAPPRSSPPARPMGMAPPPPNMGAPPGFAPPPPPPSPAKAPAPASAPSYGEAPPPSAPEESEAPPAHARTRHGVIVWEGGPGGPMPPTARRAGSGVSRGLNAPPSREQREEKPELSRKRMKAEDSDPESLAAPKPKQAQRMAPIEAPVAGQARIAFVSGAVATIEFFFGMVPPGVMFRHGDVTATLVLSNGQEVSLSVLSEQSSREGSLMPNLVYRLALAAPFALERETITTIRVTFGAMAVDAS